MSMNRLFEAAIRGDVETLHQLIQENPMVLADYALMSPHEGPLHVATKAGQLGFVKEMIRLKPDSVSEPNDDGFRPLDIASALGHVEIVKELLASSSLRHDICRLKGRDGKTAIHYAATNGKVETMDELITFSPECLKDVTVFGETVLHISVKYYRFEAFRNVVEWLENLGFEEMMNWGDKDGNTVLHLAVSRKQHQSVQLLLGRGKLDLNATNSRGLTARDIIDILIENPSDVQLKEILQSAGAKENNANLVTTNNAINNNQEQSDHDHEKDWIKYFRYQKKRDSPSDTRNALLVVATLIATVTFQAGVNPPDSFSVEKSQNNLKNNNISSTPEQKLSFSSTTDYDIKNLAPSPMYSQMDYYPRAGQPLVIGFSAVLANLGTHLAASELFLLGNSMGLAASLNVIIYLTAGFPFQRELHISIYSMMFAYGLALQDLQAEESYRHAILGVAFLLPFSLRWFPRWAKRIWKCFNVKISRNHQLHPL